jgi:kynurenine--oxoglutarate transaminase/cysteine-S-conjugate beta-lyase/glutamine--phenylpyruvate transaminase
LSQEVIARCFEYELKRLNSPECYFNSISNEFLEKRDKIVQVLKECGMKPIVPDGGYFILADYSQLAGDQFQSDANDMKDFKFVRYLTKEKVE